MKVAVFGAGTMGSGIAQVFAAKGHTALMYASSVASAQKHKDKLAASLQKRVEKGKMTQEAVDALLANVLVEEKSACADADLIIECGMLMEANAAVVMMTPILLPLLNAFGIDLLQFGIVMSFNLCIGLVTPPVGLCLLLCNQTGETRLSLSLKAMMPMLLISIIVLFLITYVSPLTTLLPSIVAG